MVLLLAASDSTVEPYEAEMGRLVMLDPMDWSSDIFVLTSLVFPAAYTFVHAAPWRLSSL